MIALRAEEMLGAAVVTGGAAVCGAAAVGASVAARDWAMFHVHVRMVLFSWYLARSTLSFAKATAISVCIAR